MEALIHSLSTMYSQVGVQTPFSPASYGMDASPEGRVVMGSVMLTTETNLGGRETLTFPVRISRVKKGVNYNPDEPNYDLFQLAAWHSVKWLFPNFSFLDAPLNLQYYRPGHPETEIAYMGYRIQVIDNVYDPSREICNGRDNLSFTTISLPRLVTKARGGLDIFFEGLNQVPGLCAGQLLERFGIQCHKHIYNYSFLMGQGVWLDNGELDQGDEVWEVLRYGTLAVDFTGLTEILRVLVGVHRGGSEKVQVLGPKTTSHMQARMDEETAKRGLNFSLIATPAEGLSGRFVKLDRARHGPIEGIIDREYYTNSFHVPVYCPISAYDKIQTEAPYHTLTNAGHTSCIEMDGDPVSDLGAFEKTIHYMKESGINYDSVNHPVDRGPVCGSSGIIGNQCPGYGRTEADGMPLERTRRITGYLVGTLDRFNSGKRTGERDRVGHLM